MKKIYLLLSFIFLFTASAFATTNCNSPCDCHKQTYNSTYQENTTSSDACNCLNTLNNCFLCTKTNKDNLFKQMNLSSTQICAANKIQDKYEQEIYSLEERIKCEQENLCKLKSNCSKKSDIRRQKRKIKDLEKKRKEICKCYQEQFKSMISKEQYKIYKQYKK